MTPREAVRCVLREPRPRRPLFIPLIYALASRVEEVPLPAFLSTPAKLVNALFRLHRALGTDGVVSHFDTGAEAEALGAALGWASYPPRVASRPLGGPGDFGAAAREALQRGRMAVGLEATRRLRSMLGDQAAVLVGLPGPVALARQLAEVPPGDLESWLGVVSRWLLGVASEFCLAGADVVLFREQGPAGPVEAWGEAMAPVMNAVRFHEALPALWFPEGGGRGSGLPCLPLLAVGEMGRLEPPPAPFGLCLPSAALEGGAGGFEWSAGASRDCVLVTCADELSPTAEMGRVREAVGQVLSRLAAEG